MDVLLNTLPGDVVSDIGVSGGDVLLDHGLQTAVVISLFSDARATEEEAAAYGDTSLRGYWADSADDRVGSKLWLLGREKALPSVAVRAKQYAEAALGWLVRDGIAASVNVSAEIVKPSSLYLGIEITRSTDKRYAYLWEGVARQMNLAAVSAPNYTGRFAYNYVTGQYEIVN